MGRLLPALAAPALAAAPAAPSPSKALQAIIADYDAFDRRVDPIGAGQDGDREALSRLPDESPAAVAEQARALAAFDARLKTLPTDALGAEDALNRTFLMGVIEGDLEGLKLDVARLNFDAYGGFHLTATALAQQTQIRDRSDADAYLTRLSRLPAFYETEIANARRGVATGFTQPRPTVDVVIAIVEKQVARPMADDPLLAEASTVITSASPIRHKGRRP